MMNKKVTIKDIARAAGVSAQTVSRVITNRGYVSAETRQKIEQIIQQSHYSPNRAASSLVTGRTMTLGLVVPNITSSYYGGIVLGAEETARAAGYITVLTNTGGLPEQERIVLDFLHDSRVDGVILISPRLPDEELLVHIAQHRAAVVVNRPVPLEFASYVTSDNTGGMFQAVEYLARLGRKTIAYLCGQEEIYVQKERQMAYLQALRRLDLPVDPELIVPFSPRPLTDSHAKGYTSTLWEELLSYGGQIGAVGLLTRRPDVDAIVCFDDQNALGVLEACAALGRRVPEDVAVIGCNDLFMARQTNPPLTTQHIPTYQMGITAVQILLEMIQGLPARKMLFEQNLVIRQSTPEARPASGSPEAKPD